MQLVVRSRAFELRHFSAVHVFIQTHKLKFWRLTRSHVTVEVPHFTMHLTRSQYKKLVLGAAALCMMGFLTVVFYELDLDGHEELLEPADEKPHVAHVEVKLAEEAVERLPDRPKPETDPPQTGELKSSDLRHIDREKALVLGHPRKDKGFLTIGIPTLHANGVSKLEQTLTSLIKNTKEDERSRVTIVVLARDLEQSAQKAVRDVVANFTVALQTGLLQLIEPPRSLDQTPEAQRNGLVKENLDNAFLLSYSRNLAEYYLQLDDRVQAVSGYLQSIRDFIRKTEKEYWVTLEFSTKPFTGKLIRSGGRDQEQLTHLMVEFGQKIPASKVYDFFKKYNVRKKTIMYNKPLFI